jgi:hypothetical protein
VRTVVGIRTAGHTQVLQRLVQHTHPSPSRSHRCRSLPALSSNACTRRGYRHQLAPSTGTRRESPHIAAGKRVVKRMWRARCAWLSQSLSSPLPGGTASPDVHAEESHGHRTVTGHWPPPRIRAADRYRRWGQAAVSPRPYGQSDESPWPQLIVSSHGPGAVGRRAGWGVGESNVYATPCRRYPARTERGRSREWPLLGSAWGSAAPSMVRPYEAPRERRGWGPRHG